MGMEIIKRRDSLFKRLQEEFKGTIVEIKPRSPKKYPSGSTAINVWCVEDNKLRIVCGMEIQQRIAPYKLWFVRHKEWERITKYPVKVWAQNGSGCGSGDGFYLNTEDEIVQEIRNYLEYYYDVY